MDHIRHPAILLLARKHWSKRWEYLVVVNFHGGSFILGSPTDDQWKASTRLVEATAVFFAVEYNLVPGILSPVPAEGFFCTLPPTALNIGVDP